MLKQEWQTCAITMPKRIWPIKVAMTGSDERTYDDPKNARRRTDKYKSIVLLHQRRLCSANSRRTRIRHIQDDPRGRRRRGSPVDAEPYIRPAPFRQSPAAGRQVERMSRREVVEASVLRVAAISSLGRVAHRAAVGLKRVVTYGPCTLV